MMLFLVTLSAILTLCILVLGWVLILEAKYRDGKGDE